MAHALGPSSEEIDDFLDQVNDVTAKLEAIKNGTDVDISEYAVTQDNDHVDPGELAARIKKVNPKAVLTPEQAEALERHEREQQEARLRRQREREADEEQKRLEKRREEKELWWRHAEYEYGHLHRTNEEGADGDAAAVETKSADAASKPKVDTLDYSRWEDWLKNPDDPVSREMLALAEAKLEEDKNDEFERNNPGFCAAFRADMAKRKKATETKEQTALKLKEKGNRAFTKKLVQRALHCYEQALELKYDLVPVLTNIAQCHLRLKQWDECLEYCNRALYVQPQNVKALSRRAKVRRLIDPPDYDSAIRDLEAAVNVEPESKALRRELEETRVAARAAADEAKVMKNAESQFKELAAMFEKLKDPEPQAQQSDRSTELSSSFQRQLVVDMIAALPESQVFLRANGQLEWLTVTAAAYLDRLLLEIDQRDGGTSNSSENTQLSAAEVRHAALVLHLLRASSNDSHNLAFMRKSGAFRSAVTATCALLRNSPTNNAPSGLPVLSCGSDPVDLAAALLRLLVRGAVDSKCQKMILGSGAAHAVRATATACTFVHNAAVLSTGLQLCGSFAAWADYTTEVTRVLSATSIISDCCAVVTNPAATKSTRERLMDTLASISHHSECHVRFSAPVTPARNAAASSAPERTVAALLLDFACDPTQTADAREYAALALTNAALDAAAREAAVKHGVETLVNLVVGCWQKRSDKAPKGVPEYLGGEAKTAGSGLRTSVAIKLLARLSRSPETLAAFRSRQGTLGVLADMASASLRACGDIGGPPPSPPRAPSALAAVKNLAQLIAVCLHGGASVPATAFGQFLTHGGLSVLLSFLLLSPCDNRYVDSAPPGAGLDVVIDNVFVGNVLSSLISAHDFLSASQLHDATELASEMRSRGALVHLVELLKCCADGPVRENAAKLVARLGRDEQSMQVIRANRGMEVLMELYASGRLKI